MVGCRKTSRKQTEKYASVGKLKNVLNHHYSRDLEVTKLNSRVNL